MRESSILIGRWSCQRTESDYMESTTCINIVYFDINTKYNHIFLFIRTNQNIRLSIINRSIYSKYSVLCLNIDFKLDN